MARSRPWLNLKARIALAIAVTGAASILAVTAYLHSAMERQAVEQWQDERRADAVSLAAGLDRSLREMAGDLRITISVPAMASLPHTAAVDPSLNGIPAHLDPDKRRALDALLEDGAFSVAFVLQPNGDHYLSHPYTVQERLRRFNLADRDYIRWAVTNRKPTLSDSFTGSDGVPSVAMALPRFDEQGRLALILGGVIHLPRLTDLFSAAVADPQDFAILADRKGEAIAVSGDLVSAGLTMAPLAERLKAFQDSHPTAGQPRSEIFDNPDKRERIVATFIAVEPGWTVMLARGWSTFETRIHPELVRIASFAALLMAAIGMLGFMLASRMAGRWERVQLELSQAHDELEERVRLRTQDLDLSRRDLEAKSGTLETILENVSHGISLFDSSLRLVAFNHHFVDLLELPPSLARTGTPLEDIVRFNAAQGAYGQVDEESFVTERLAEAAMFKPRRSQRTTRAGRILEVQETPLPTGGFVATHTDITEETKAEEALLTLSRAVEQSPVSVVITSPDGAIEYVNPRFEVLTGFRAAEVMGRNPSILKSGLVSPETYAELWRTIQAGGTWEGELQNRRKDGELFWESASISPIRSPEGKVMHFLAVKEDITDRKRAEAQVLAAWAAAEEANRAKTVFLSHMSHELRTPLTAVLGYAEMMHDQIAGPLPEAYEDYVQSIMTSGEHLLAIIDEVLDISRIELGSFKITPTPLDLASIAADCVAMLTPQCAAKGIHLAMPRADSTPILSDERAVRQVLINLLGNAVKYTQHGGIAINITIGKDGQAQAEIRDTGCGIPAEKLENIFEPFQRVDPLRADPARGVGLGLAICRRIAGLLGGTLELDSEEGRGTTARFSLPIRRD